MVVGRKMGSWHLWLGVGLVLPLIWWLSTAIVFITWPMDVVRGRHLAGGQTPAVEALPAGLQVPASLLEGARTLTVRRVDGHILAVAHRPEGPQVWDLDRGVALGPVIPFAWVEQIARKDFRGSFEIEEVYLYGPEGIGKRLVGSGPESLPTPGEFSGPFPAYAFHLASGPSAHFYVDALTGEARQRRTGIWRAYDLAFRLHSLEFLPEGIRRPLMGLVGLGGLLAALTGTLMAWKRLRKRPAKALH